MRQHALVQSGHLRRALVVSSVSITGQDGVGLDVVGPGVAMGA
jgi:hypothetical protein